jgi:hypothetical protein
MMLGMDKQHDGHARIRIITFQIKNDMGLVFCTSSCTGHLNCMIEIVSTLITSIVPQLWMKQNGMDPL